jgi:2-oxoglutarate ferredoxin oxidoreductase subunit alpha
MTSREQRLAAQPTTPSPASRIVDIPSAAIRFAGDASDGMHLIGSLFTSAAAAFGNTVFTLPDFPAEIRSPPGTLAGVSAFQVHLGSHEVYTPGDSLQALVAMNPAALAAHLRDLDSGGVLVANADTFIPDELMKAGWTTNPLTDGTLKDYRVVAAPIDMLNREAVSAVNLIPREASRCRGYYPLGIALWLFDKPLDSTLRWLRETYAKNPAMIEAASRSLRAGFQFAQACGLRQQIRVSKAAPAPGRYRRINGTESMALGLVSAAHRTKVPMVFASFPLTPASELLRTMTEYRQPDIQVVQAEDDVAALNLVLGAAFGGALGVTATTGPGLSLQSEALGLAVMTELPCVIIDVQRAGPSTGMPTRTEQADLLQALHGRHGEAPVIVLAMSTPGDGFEVVQEAVRLAIRAMAPVIVLADAYLAHAAQMWRVPAAADLSEMPVTFAVPGQPLRVPDDRGVKPWAAAGTPGLEHRIGGLERHAVTGNVSYDAENHERMVRARAAKIASLAHDIPPLTVDGPETGDLLVLGWGSTCGAIQAAANRCRARGANIATANLRYLAPLPRNTLAVLRRYRKVLLPELNMGQLAQLLRAVLGVEVISMTKVQGRSFTVAEIASRMDELSRDS